MYKVKINEFEGPLDLLLHLIKESNIDIYNISIDEITKQYLDYINQMEQLDIEIASEYLVMASELMLLKSKALLPINKEEVEEEEEVTKENLINRLIEYQKYKNMTNNFKNLETERRNIHTKSPSKIKDYTDNKFTNNGEITLEDLMQAFTLYLERKNKEIPLNTKITNKEYSVQKRKKDIKHILFQKGKTEFKDLFDIYSKSYIVVTFLSILELAKEEEVILKQENNFANLYIELRNIN